MKKFYSGLVLLVFSVNLFGFGINDYMVTLKSNERIGYVDDCFFGQSIELKLTEECSNAVAHLKNKLVYNYALGDKKIFSVDELGEYLSFAEKLDQSAFKIWYSKNDNQIVVTAKENIRFSGVLFDITGSIVLDQRKNFVDKRMVFQTFGLKKGIYVVALYGPGGTVLNISKVVVN